MASQFCLGKGLFVWFFCLFSLLGEQSCWLSAGSPFFGSFFFFSRDSPLFVNAVEYKAMLQIRRRPPHSFPEIIDQDLNLLHIDVLDAWTGTLEK